MLKKINEGGVESSDGFTIQIIGPEIMNYSYKGYNVNLEINYDFRNKKVLIFASNITNWNDGYTNINIDENDKTLMIKNIKEAVKLLNGDFEVI